MPKRRRRSFTPLFKAQVVLEVLSGQRSASESARQHKLKPELISRWKDIALEGLEVLFEGDDQRSRGRAPHHGAGSRNKSLGLARPPPPNWGCRLSPSASPSRACSPGSGPRPRD
jgi:transposase